MTSPFTPTGNFGISLFGLDPYGSEYGSFGVVGAVAYTNTTVQIQFSDLIDLNDLDFTRPSNYSVYSSSSSLTVIAATIESANSVVLITEPTQPVEYTVTVSAGRSRSQVPLDPRYDTARFVGLPQLPTYFSCGTTSTRVRIIFNTAVQSGPATDRTNYTVTDFNGHALPISSVASEQAGGSVSSVVLTLGTPMGTTQWYQTTLSSNVKSIDGYSFSPLTHDFQWVQPVQTTSVPIQEFSNRHRGGPEIYFSPSLLQSFREDSSGPVQEPSSQPDTPSIHRRHTVGQVFFSPSLNVAASNSVIEVEEVTCCTTAYDQYHFPQPVDPSPFYVWSPATPTVLGQAGVVLWGGFPRLGEARFELESYLEDTMPEAFDGCCSILMREPFDPSYVSLLNDPAWSMFDETHSTTPPMFICADITQGPIPPGPESITVLQCALVGGSSFTAAASPQGFGAKVGMVGSSTFTTDIQGATNLRAASWMRVARASQNHGAVAAINGTSTLANSAPGATSD
jgi:hypothetical protein